MKITIYELIGLIKDGAAPREIIYNDRHWYYTNGSQDYFNIIKSDNLLAYLFKYKPITDFINDEVEIIEEDKKIEYEQIEELTCNKYDFEKKTINSLIKNQRKLIDEINKLKEST